MVQIEITKQPLYGTVYWDGYNFIYTPKLGFTGNDIYYYTKNENGVTSSHINYVNPTNIAPVATNVSLTADAYYKTTININQLMVDNTNPFNNLKIVSIEKPTKGKIQNDGTNLYYYPNALNTVEHLDYVISDKQYFSTGTLTLSVLNGRVELPLENTTFKYRLIRDYASGNTIPSLTSNWDSSALTLNQYKDIWTTIDTTKYVAFSNYIESASGTLNQVYHNVPIYNGLYLSVSPNSSSWINDRNIIDYVKNNKQKLINTYNVLLDKNSIWNNDYTNYSIISTAIDNNISNTESMYETITNHSTDWDSNEIYNILEHSKESWDINYSILSTSQKNIEWNNALSSTTYLSSGISVDSVDFNNLYNTITSKSAIWSNQETEAVMVSSGNWDNVYSSYNLYNNLYNILTSNSGLWVKDRNKKDIIYSLLTSNSSNWNNLYNILTGTYASNWSLYGSLNNILSTDIYNNNSTYNTLTAGFQLWNNISYIYSQLSLSAQNINNVKNNKDLYNNLYNILTANSGLWIKDRNTENIISSVLFSNSANWNNLYNILTGTYGSNWNGYSGLTPVLSTDIYNNNSTYNTVTANSGLWSNTNINNYLNSVSGNLIGVYNIISSLSNSWNTVYNTTTAVSSDYNKNITNLNNYTNLVSTASSLWNNIVDFGNSISLSTTNWNIVLDSNYDVNLYSILCSNSSTWYKNVSLLTSISTFLFNQSPNWILMYDLIIAGDWLNSGNYYDILSSVIGSNNIKFSNLYNTVTANSTKWASADFYNTKLSAIPLWDSTYDTLINKNKYDSWNNAITDLQTLSTTFYKRASSLNALNVGIDNSLYIWNNKVGSTVLTGNSANWYNSYSTVCGSSANWFFNNKSQYSSTYSYVTANSGKLTNVKNIVSLSSYIWDNNATNLSPTLISQFLTGSGTINLSTNNLYVIGDTYIAGNLSALGGKFSIDTTLNTTSGFIINNSNNSDAVVIDKVGGKAILNLYMANSPVLYVKAAPKVVGINLSAVNDSNIALTVSGNISATGYVYPVPEYLTLYSSKSAAYETAYTYVTANSAAINTFILNTKPVYDSMVNYINGNSISSFSGVTIPFYDNYVKTVNDYSSQINQTSSFIALSGNVLDIDNLFGANSSKYETTYNYVSSTNNSSKYTISHFFGHNLVLQTQKVNVVVQDNIKIQSWALYANELISSNSIIFPISSYKTIDGGENFTLALGIDGTLSAWGGNFNGQLGNNTTTDSKTAIKVNVPPVAAIACGQSHTLALGFDGTLSAWGANWAGQLGNGTTTQSKTAIKVNVPPVAAVACGNNYTMVIGIDGGLSAWGDNSSGQLGDGTTTQSNSPIKINVSPVAAIDCGGVHTLALGFDGTLSAWGFNSSGQLGNGTTTQSKTAIKINVPPVRAVACGNTHTMAIGIDGGLSGWGNNTSCQLGDGISLNRLSAIKINVPSVAAVACGFDYTMVIGMDGGLSAFGSEIYGQLGDGHSGGSFIEARPVKINAPPVTAVACGYYHTLALGIDGTLSAWGFNSKGQLGNNTILNSSTAVKINIPTIKTPTTTNLTINLNPTQTLTYNLSVDILSSTHANFGKVGNPVSITNGNPPYLTTFNKNSASNLDSIWTGTTLPKGSIIQFQLINTNISPVSGLLINLVAIKQ